MFFDTLYIRLIFRSDEHSIDKIVEAGKYYANQHDELPIPLGQFSTIFLTELKRIFS